MLHLALAAIALGIAGFDPLGVVALVAALALGVRRAGIVALVASVVASTFLFGLVPALVLGPAVGRASHAVRHVSHTVWGPLVVLVGIGLTAWGVVRLVRPAPPHDEQARAPRSTSTTAMALTGAAVGLSAFADPAFYGVIVVAARQTPLRAAVMLLLWVAGSHCALLVAGAAALLGLYEPLHRRIEQARTRWARPLAVAASVALVAVGLLCVAEGVAEWHHHWLLPPGVGHRHR